MWQPADRAGRLAFARSQGGWSTMLSRASARSSAVPISLRQIVLARLPCLPVPRVSLVLAHSLGLAL